jgi:hypothetical protein
MSHLNPNTKIAYNTDGTPIQVKYWLDLRKHLIKTTQHLGWDDNWEQAWNIFERRIHQRFISPLNHVLAYDSDQKKGEGFLVMIIVCILMEHLGSLYQGKIYTTKEENLLPFEYNSSKSIFVDFLTTQPPFKDYFDSRSAKKFYEKVRCGLLHEARTKANWKIHDKKGKALLISSGGDLYIYRTTFFDELKEWVYHYKTSLKDEVILRNNFIRKIDDICDIKHKLYFAYGSNIDRLQVAERLSPSYFHSVELGILENCELVFNKKSDDGTAKANIREPNNKMVYGLLYKMDESDIKALAGYEKGYDKIPKMVKRVFDKKEYEADVFVYKHDREEFSPSKKYAEKIVNAMDKEEFPKDYVEELKAKLNSLTGQAFFK